MSVNLNVEPSADRNNIFTANEEEEKIVDLPHVPTGGQTTIMKKIGFKLATLLGISCEYGVRRGVPKKVPS